MSDARGRTADSPTDIPGPGWRDIAIRVKREISEDHTSLVAAGVSFFAFVAFIPGLAAAISIYGLISDPSEVERQLSGLLGNLPEEAQQLVADQIARLAGASTGALTWGTIIAIGLALWTASSGMANLIESLNITYDEKDDRGFFIKRSLALVLTLGAVVLLIAIAFAVTVVGPWLVDNTGSDLAGWTGVVVSWLLAGAAFVTGLAFLYKYGPDRDDPEWQWVSVGSVVAVVLWLLASILFRIYVANFGSYNETYGSLAAVVILLFWLYITCFLILFGAEINAEMEHQTREDTTVGPDQPMGERGAVMADTLGERPAKNRDA